MTSVSSSSSSSSSSSASTSVSNSAPSQPKGKLLWHNIAFMTLTPLVALIFTPLYIYFNGIQAGHIWLLLIVYTISNLSITTGYHRYFSHRSFDAHPLVERLFIFLATGAFQGSVLNWCTDHRRHHRLVDTDSDPYSIKKGFLFAHLTWMFRADLHPEALAFPKDLTKNKWIVLQHKYYPILCFLIGFGLPGLIGWSLGLGFWGGFLFGGVIRTTLSQHSTFLINSAAHTFGRLTYTDKNTARDSFILAILTFGEGYHNFHHYFQADYRNGVRWYQWDPTKWIIQGLSVLGLATRLKTAQKEEILKARLGMEVQQLEKRGACAIRLADMKTRVVEAAHQLRARREDYMKAIRNRPRSPSFDFGRHRAKLKEEIRLAKLEFRVALQQWQTFRKAVLRAPAGAAI